MKLRQDGKMKYNSPWNIEADFLLIWVFRLRRLLPRIVGYDRPAVVSGTKNFLQCRSSGDRHGAYVWICKSEGRGAGYCKQNL